MTQNEINSLVEQYLSQNKVKVIRQSSLKKHNIPTFGQQHKVRGGMWDLYWVDTKFQFSITKENTNDKEN